MELCIFLVQYIVEVNIYDGIDCNNLLYFNYIIICKFFKKKRERRKKKYKYIVLVDSFVYISY